MVESKNNNCNGSKMVLLRMIQLGLLVILIDLAHRQVPVVSGNELPECKELNVLKPPRFGKRDAYINRYQGNKCINRRRRLVNFHQLKPYLILNWAMLHNSQTPTPLFALMKQVQPLSIANQEMGELNRDQAKDYFVERLKMLAKLRQTNLATENDSLSLASEELSTSNGQSTRNKKPTQPSDNNPAETLSYWHRIRMRQA